MSWQIYLISIASIVLFLSSIFDSTLVNALLNTTSGIYAGRTVDCNHIKVKQYLGIQYGRINKRFQRATLVEKVNNQIIKATSPGPLCKPTAGTCITTTGDSSNAAHCSVSYGIFSTKSMLAEQCLYLNVFIPVTPYDKRRKAIFMWIHGGSGQVGTGNVFDGTVLAALGDIIVVTFNFRLNLFGFLSSGDDRLEGNAGLYDQALVLDWIYINANALGGDIQRITVGGHSAGAPHAYYLAMSPFNNGRIRRLLLQSGSPFNVWSHLKAQDAMEKFNMVADDNKCGHMKTFGKKLKCLEERDFNLIAEYEHHSYNSANHTNVVTNGNFMSEFREIFQENDTLTNIDLLIGSTDDEGVFVAIVPILMEQHTEEVIVISELNFTAIALKFLATMQPNKTCLHNRALELYHINKIPVNCYKSLDCFCSSFYNYSRLISDILFYIDYYRFLEQRLKYSNRTYIYQYSYKTSQEHPTPCNDYLHKHDLVGHFAELEYTWGTPFVFEMNSHSEHVEPLVKYIRHISNATINMNASKLYTDEQIEFSKQIIERWSNFIKYGQPTDSKFKNEWPSASNISSAFIMHLQINRSEVKNLIIPPNVHFWKAECQIQTNKVSDVVPKNDQTLSYKLSNVILIYSMLIIKIFISIRELI